MGPFTVNCPWTTPPVTGLRPKKPPVPPAKPPWNRPPKRWGPGAVPGVVVLLDPPGCVVLGCVVLGWVVVGEAADAATVAPTATPAAAPRPTAAVTTRRRIRWGRGAASCCGGVGVGGGGGGGGVGGCDRGVAGTSSAPKSMASLSPITGPP